jgi:hypothetical protein
MRVVFRSPSVPAVERAPDGRTTPGTAFFEARVYEPGDDLAHVHAEKVSDWLRTSVLNPDGSFSSSPPPLIVGPAPVAIPAAVIQGLQPESLLEIAWQINYGTRS